MRDKIVEIMTREKLQNANLFC